MTRWSVVGLIVVAGVALASCGGKGGGTSAAKPAAGLGTKTVEAGAVEVSVTPRSVQGGTAVFEVSFNTHSVDLGFDVARTAALTVDGKAAAAPTWSGGGAGGHHRAGTLRFRSVPGGSQLRLTLRGVPEPAVFRWTVKEGTAP